MESDRANVNIVELHDVWYQSGWSGEMPAITNAQALVSDGRRITLYERTPKNDWRLALSVSVDDVASIDVDLIEGSRHEYGWKPTTGFLNRGKTTPTITGVVLVLRSGEHVLMRVRGQAPIEVRAKLGPLVALLS